MIAEIVASAVPSVAITDDFDTDFGVYEWHGTNAFIRDGDRVSRKGNRVHIQRKMVLRTSHHFAFCPNFNNHNYGQRNRQPRTRLVFAAVALDGSLLAHHILADL
jgi:hypothetical protein